MTEAEVDLLFWRVVFLVAVVGLAGLLISVRLQVDRLQHRMDTTVQLLLTWARLWGHPVEEVRAALLSNTASPDRLYASQRHQRPEQGSCPTRAVVVSPEASGGLPGAILGPAVSRPRRGDRFR